jgi:hypothetical protein
LKKWNRPSFDLMPFDLLLPIRFYGNRPFWPSVVH